MKDGNAHPSPPEPFFLHQKNNQQQHSSNALPSMPALPLESQIPDLTTRSRSRSTRKNKKPIRSKSSGMIEYASLDFFMTDTKYKTAECSCSEKQVSEISSMNSYKSLGENCWDKPLGETQDKPSWSDTKTPEVSPGCSV